MGFNSGFKGLKHEGENSVLKMEVYVAKYEI